MLLIKHVAKGGGGAKVTKYLNLVGFSSKFENYSKLLRFFKRFKKVAPSPL